MNKKLVSNKATALLMLPIAIATASAAGIDPRGMAVAVAVAASASFLIPIGYQPNTMVFGAPVRSLVVIVLALMVPTLYGI